MVKCRESLFFLFHFFLVFGYLQISQIKASDCYFQQSFEDAYVNSQMIFLGRAIEDKPIALATKGGSELDYKEVRFQVEKSWKLVDKQYVWLRIPAQRNDSCGYNGVNLRHLVYANQSSGLIFISPASRTMSAEIAAQDIEKLGDKTLLISDGEFKVIGSQIWIILTITILIIAVIFFTFLIKRGKFQKE